jgi:hypothetical protein
MGFNVVATLGFLLGFRYELFAFGSFLEKSAIGFFIDDWFECTVF